MLWMMQEARLCMPSSCFGRLTINTGENTEMKLSKLIAIVGDEFVEVQHLWNDYDKVDIKGGKAVVAFNTSPAKAASVGGLGEVTHRGIVVWLPCERMQENLAKYHWQMALASVVGRKVTGSQLLDSLKQEGVEEGSWDGICESIERLSHVETDDEGDYIDTRPTGQERAAPPCLMQGLMGLMKEWQVMHQKFTAEGNDEASIAVGVCHDSLKEKILEWGESVKAWPFPQQAA